MYLIDKRGISMRITNITEKYYICNNVRYIPKEHVLNGFYTLLN